jgi:large subunit ribosomal protein L20
MARVKGGVTTHARHKKMLSLTKGYKHGRKNLFRLAKQAVLKAGTFAYRDRKVKKRTFRGHWIVVLNAAVRKHDLSYSQFIYGLHKAQITLNRRVLAELAANHPEQFDAIVAQVKQAA